MGTEQIQRSGSISRNKKVLLHTKLFRDNKRLASAVIANHQQFVGGNGTGNLPQLSLLQHGKITLITGVYVN